MRDNPVKTRAIELVLHAQADPGTTRSGALRATVRALRATWLEDAYAEADEEWYADGEPAVAWDATTGDSLAAED